MIRETFYILNYDCESGRNFILWRQ